MNSTCTLRVINDALKTGHATVKCEAQLLLRLFYKVFKNSPACLEDHIDWTGSELFPKKFCSVRWIENVDVFPSALAVFADVRKYISTAKKLPTTFMVTVVKEVCTDQLMPANIAVFNSVAFALEPFLCIFQTNAPMGPFLYVEVFNIIEVLMDGFIKKDVVAEAKTAKQLSEIDVSSNKVQLELSDLDVGVAANSFVAKPVSQLKTKKHLELTVIIFLQ